MKNSTLPQNTDSNGQKNEDILKASAAKQPEVKSVTLNETLLASLPYPAMYVRQKDRMVVAANKIATDFGAKVGGYCWRGFGKGEYISEDNQKIAIKHPQQVPEELHIQCSFCQADACLLENPCQNNPAIKAFDRIWDTYWIRVSDEVFLHYLIDITEQKQLEKSLRESELFLKQTQQIAMLGTYNLDVNSGQWQSSEVLDSIFGIDDQFDKTLENWVSIIHPEWQKIMINYFRNEVVSPKNKFDKEYKIIRINDKAERWVHGLGDLRVDDNGEVINMIGTIRDITERKQEQSEITRNLKFTEVLLKSIPIPIFFTDSNGLYTGCNEAFTKQTGLSNSDVDGKSVMDLWPGNESKVYYERDLKLLSTKEFQHFETQIPDKNNQIRDVIFAKNVYFDEVGEVAGIVGTYIDITEQKKTENTLRESEQRYQLLAENITDGIFICKNGQLEYVNKSMLNIFGYEGVELNRFLLTELVVENRRADFEAHIFVEETTTNQVTNIEIECIKKDNSTVFVEMFLNYVATEGAIYGVVHDITVKKQIRERNIIKAIIQTEEKERANFSKELHDGLGPLLSTIKLYLQWSVRPKSNRSRKEIILKAEDILEEALTAVKEISNKLSPHLLTNYGLTSAVQNFAHKLEDTNAIKIDFQSNITRRVEMEVEVALYRAIIECVNNTIKYARAKHIFIKLEDAKNQINLQYRDDGKGFDIVKILGEKKGLGLFNLQNRVQTIGGEIKMFSKPREGVNYHISVPVK